MGPGVAVSQCTVPERTLIQAPLPRPTPPIIANPCHVLCGPPCPPHPIPPKNTARHSAVHLRPVEEEADHEDSGPLQPAHVGGGGGKRHQHGGDAQRVGNHDLREGRGGLTSLCGLRCGGQLGSVGWRNTSACCKGIASYVRRLAQAAYRVLSFALPVRMHHVLTRSCT